MTRGRARVIVLAGTVALCLFTAETVVRVADGYRLTQVRLVHRAGESVTPLQLPPTTWPTAGADAIAAPHLRAIAHPADVDERWFFSDPPLPPRKPARPDLDALSDAHSDQVIGKFARREWNLNFVLDAARRRQSYWEYLKQVRTPLRVFDPAGHTLYPRYRMLPNDPHAEAWASGTFATNNLGYRGADVAIPKPSKTFRIVFVGASTTIDHPSLPLSFTDYVAHFLNLWARSRGLDVRFEAINAAREGLQSQDIAAVVEQEVPRLSPDLVVYKEGANQFSAAKRLLTVSDSKARPVDADFLLTGVVEDWPGLAYSAALRRLRALSRPYIRLREAPKPPYTINWPPQLDEEHPDLDRRDLPLDLADIVHDLSRIQKTLQPLNAGFALSTFVWMSEDDLSIDASKLNERALYWYLNGNEILWPLRYHDVKRFARFQNTVFRRFCEQRGVDLVDLDRWFPRNPALFIDAIHLSYAGVKIHGWITSLQLLPVIERRLAQHVQPRTVTDTSGETRAAITVAKIEAMLAEGADPLPLPQLADWTAGSPDVRLSIESGRLRVAGTASRWAYQIVSAPIRVRADHYYRVHLDTRVRSGAIGVGVLDQTRSSWITSPLDTSAFTFNSGTNEAVYLVVADATPQLAPLKQNIFEIEQAR